MTDQYRSEQDERGRREMSTFNIYSNGKRLKYPLLRILFIVTVAYWAGVLLGHLP